MSGEAVPLPPARPATLAVVAPPATDWVVRLYERAPLSPLRIGALLVVVHTGCSLVLRWALGEEVTVAWAALDVLNALLFAFMPTATVLLRRGVLRDLATLRSDVITDDSSFDEVVRRTVGVPRAWLLVCGALMALAFILMPVLDPRFWGGDVRPPLSDPQLLSFAVRSGITGWLIGHALAAEIWTTIRYAQLGAEGVRIDLHDVDRLAPFARRGMRSAFTWILCVSLVSLFWLSNAAGSANAVVVALTLLLAGVQVVVTAVGARDGVRAAKRARLHEIDERIRTEAERVLAPGDASPADARLADLVAYRSYLESIHEWPLGRPALLRFLLLALLGLGSWLGGALVERVLDQALG